MPAVYNLKDQRVNDSFRGVRFRIKRQIDGQPVDLSSATGITAKFKGGYDNKVLKTLTLGSGITMNDSLGGDFSLDPFIITMPNGVYKYDVQIDFPGNIKTTYIEGTVDIKPDL